MILDTLLSGAQYERPQAEKEALLLPAFKELTRHHMAHCAPYAKILALAYPHFEQSTSLASLPYLPIGLFKTHSLQSVENDSVRVHMTSSGTSGQKVSRIVADDTTARNQSRAMAAVMRGVLGAERLPLLLLDCEETLRNRQEFNARAVGILGMMSLGRTPTFVLDSQMNLRWDVLKDFLQRYGRQPFLMFGFTYMVWRYFHQQILREGLDCRQGILIHGGGWKKLTHESVDNLAFRAALKGSCGLSHIYNYYGMIEQPGTLFLEGSDGYLYPPAFGDVIIRDPQTWRVLPPGQLGVIQVLSLIPHSYPGHSVLTEDMGMIMHTDGHPAWKGHALKVVGRAPKAELRGCSDVQAYGAIS